MTVLRPADRFAEAMARADGCPECVTNYQTPYHADLMDAGYTVFYQCGTCGHTWTTTWGDC